MARRPTDWQSSYLAAAGLPNSQANRNFLSSWQKWEGGHTANNARWNYLNTTQRMPGARSINSVGVKAYRSLNEGARAWAKTIRNGLYTGLYDGLRQSKPASQRAVAGLSTWLSGSPTAGLDYAHKVLGTKVPAPAPSKNAPTGMPGTPGTPGKPGKLFGLTEYGKTPQFDFAKAGARQLSAIAQGEDPTEAFGKLVNQYVNFNAPRPSRQQTYRTPGKAGAIAPVAPGVNAVVQGKMTPEDARAIQLARHYLGTPYSWGGGGPSGPTRGIARGAGTVGFDCSGLIEYVWAKQGIRVGGTTYEQIKNGRAVNPSTKSLRPGDAVFFGDPKAPHHVGMYIGGGKFIESPHTGAVVRISKLAGRQPSAARRYG